jgi:hypothetical protein
MAQKTFKVTNFVSIGFVRYFNWMQILCPLSDPYPINTGARLPCHISFGAISSKLVGFRVVTRKSCVQLQPSREYRLRGGGGAVRSVS